MFDLLTSANRVALIHRVESMKRAESRGPQDHRGGGDAGARRDALPTEGGSPRTGRPGRRRPADSVRLQTFPICGRTGERPVNRWSEDEYEAWLARTLRTQLLPAPSA